LKLEICSVKRSLRKMEPGERKEEGSVEREQVGHGWDGCGSLGTGGGRLIG
jgi:hypothetical protein